MAEVGSVFVSILPSAKGFRSALDKAVGSDVDRSGESAGKTFGDSFTGATKATIGSSSSSMFATAGDAANRDGDTAGKTFGANFTDAARRNVGDLDIGATTKSGADKAGGVAGRTFGDEFSTTAKREIDSSASGSGSSSMMGGLTAAAKTAGKTGALAVGAAVGAAVGYGFLEGLSREAGSDKLAAQLGVTPKESKRLGRIAGDLYVNAYGDSMGGVNDALRGVSLNIPGMDPSQLKPITAGVLDIAAAWDEDSDAISRAAGQLVKTGMAKDAREALDIIVTGFQNGANKSDDLLDTFNEYGTQFRKLGLDGKDALGLLTQGLQGGARDADIVADTFKEFSIRAVDGSEATAEGFEALGLDASTMGDRVAAGGKSAADATDLVLDKLRKVEDPAKRGRIAVKLFGTQAEDMGGALNRIDFDKPAKGIGDIGGAARRMGDTLNTNGAAKIEAFKRKAQEVLIDFVGNKVIPALERAWQWIKTNLGPVWENHVLPGLQKFGAWIRDKVIPAGVRLIEWFSANWPAIKEHITSLAETAKNRFITIKNAFWMGMRWGGNLSAAIFRMAADIVSAFTDVVRSVLNSFDAILNAAEIGLGWIPGIGDKIKNANTAFDNFRDSTVADLEAVEAKLRGAAEQADRMGEKKITFEIGFSIDRSGLSGLPELVGNGGRAIMDMASGGRVTPRGRIVHIGEGKEPESVLPDSVLRGLLERSAAGGGGDSSRGGMFGDVHVQAHDYGDFMAQMQRRSRAAAAAYS